MFLFLSVIKHKITPIESNGDNIKIADLAIEPAATQLPFHNSETCGEASMLASEGFINYFFNIL